MGEVGGGEEKAFSLFHFHLSPFPPLSAPTGAGKSLTFELAPYTFDRLFGEDCNAIVLVIVLLISLMKDQVSNLNSRGIRASSVGDDCSEEQLKDILNLKEKILFGSPEAIVNNYRHIYRDLKRNHLKSLLETIFAQSIQI